MNSRSIRFGIMVALSTTVSAPGWVGAADFGAIGGAFVAAWAGGELNGRYLQDMNQGIRSLLTPCSVS